MKKYPRVSFSVFMIKITVTVTVIVVLVIFVVYGLSCLCLHTMAKITAIPVVQSSVCFMM